MNTELSPNLRKQLLHLARSERTEHLIYLSLAQKTKNEKNKKILERIANDELGHAIFWEKLLGSASRPSLIKAQWYIFVARAFGLTFGLKLMEKGEDVAQILYKKIVQKFPTAEYILKDEEVHEKELLNLIEEERLQYVGSIVLGLNDALVELTGALAGMSFAFENTKLTGFAGLITGIAASMSMGASSYLSRKADGDRNALKSSIYTGIAYIFTVLLLVLPFFVSQSPVLALIATLGISLFIIFIFNFYISVAKDLRFQRQFWEMALISLGVASITFGIGIFVRLYFGISV